MPAEIPTSVPLELGAGRSAAWSIALPDYLATDGYSLRYVLHDGTHKIEFMSEADEGDHLVTISSADSAEWAPGDYRYQAYAEKTGESWLVAEGMIRILPDFAAATTLDARSNAEIQLANINETITALTTKQMSSYSTVSGSFTRQSLPDLYKLRAQLQAEVARELAAKNPFLRRGGRILTRFAP